MNQPQSSERASKTFDGMWEELEPIGRDRSTGGYERFAWTREDSLLREWFVSEADKREMGVVEDRAGNQWAWWGDPDRAITAGHKGIVMGSHLDSVPQGGAFDGPLGVISAFAVVDVLREQGITPTRPVGVVRFGDEEGARFGVACAGSRLITGTLNPAWALSLLDSSGTSMADAIAHTGRSVKHIGRDPDTLSRIGIFLELHIEQGRMLADIPTPVGIGSSIWPHGRWRLELHGQANHAGTTPIEDRQDPMLELAQSILTARRSAVHHQCVATIGKVRVEPNGVNAIPSLVTAWLDARGPREADVRAVASEVMRAGATSGVEESFTPATVFDSTLSERLVKTLGGCPLLATGAGHDAGVLAVAGIPTALLFVRNPTGISHSPTEYAERADCLAGVSSLATAVAELASEFPS